MKLIKPYYIIEDEFDGDEVLKKIEKIGRVCYKSENMITEESAKKFVKMLINKGHEAMIEHFSFSVRFVCDRGISHELVRHRLASYAQESTRYCVAGDTNLTFKNAHNRMSVADLHQNKITSRNGAWKRVLIKNFNEKTGILEFNKIKDIYLNGKKQTYKIKTKLGYELILTEDHQILTNEGYKSIKNGLDNMKIAVNGSDLTNKLYRNRDWLYYHYITKMKTAVDIAKEFGYNVSTIKKWVKKLDMPKKPKSYWNIDREPWNKGKHVESQLEALKKYKWTEGRYTNKTPKERMNKLTTRTYGKLRKNKCEICNSVNTLNVHHIDNNRENNLPHNLITLCIKCHHQIHNKNLQTIYFDEIETIKKYKVIDVYDIEMFDNHNFVANGIIVHNCNYSKDKFGNQLTLIRPCFVDEKYIPVGQYKYCGNKGDIVFKAEDCDDYKSFYSIHRDEEKSNIDKYKTMINSLVYTELAYLELLESGFTPQESRHILPSGLKTEVVQTMNLREWRHFLKLRTHETAHPQMRELTIPLLKELKEKIPVIFDDVKLKDEVLHE